MRVAARLAGCLSEGREPCLAWEVILDDRKLLWFCDEKCPFQKTAF